MSYALNLAAKASDQGEVPVGAVLVRDNTVLGEGFNQPLSQNDPTAHAEIMAIRQAGQQVGNYRLLGSTLYVTLEPCPMCVGAMIHARIERLVFGAYDCKTGAAGSVFELLNDTRHNHQIIVEGGVLQQTCAEQLQAFFRTRRASQKAAKQAQASTQVPQNFTKAS